MDNHTTIRKIAWFAALWLGSVLAVSLLALAIKMVL
ncbi:MAG: hypothetical protein RIR97_2039 [Pseudomonadota bacterium]|jgi:hypothetical protein